MPRHSRSCSSDASPGACDEAGSLIGTSQRPDRNRRGSGPARQPGIHPPHGIVTPDMQTSLSRRQRRANCRPAPPARKWSRPLRGRSRRRPPLRDHLPCRIPRCDHGRRRVCVPLQGPPGSRQGPRGDRLRPADGRVRPHRRRCSSRASARTAASSSRTRTSRPSSSTRRPRSRTRRSGRTRASTPSASSRPPSTPSRATTAAARRSPSSSSATACCPARTSSPAPTSTSASCARSSSRSA